MYMLHSLIQFIYKLLALSVEYLILIGQVHHPAVCYSQITPGYRSQQCCTFAHCKPE